jgi:hypothetical protein
MRELKVVVFLYFVVCQQVAISATRLTYDEALELMIEDRADHDVLTAFRIENKEVKNVFRLENVEATDRQCCLNRLNFTIPFHGN